VSLTSSLYGAGVVHVGSELPLLPVFGVHAGTVRPFAKSPARGAMSSSATVLTGRVRGEPPRMCSSGSRTPHEP